MLCVNQRLINTHMEKLRKSNRTSLDPDALRWTPLVHTNLALIDKENEAANGTHAKNGTEDTGEEDKEVPENASDRQVDVINSSLDDKSKDGLIVNGVGQDEEGESASEEDDEGPIIRPRKRRRSNTLSDSGSDKIEGKADEEGVSKNQASSRKETDSETAASKTLNSAEPETGVVKKRMKLNDEEPRADVSDDSADNSDSDDSSSSSSSSSASSSEDSDNGEPMDDNEDNPARETEGGHKGSEDGTSESSSEMNNSPAGVYAGFGSQSGPRDPLAGLTDPEIGMDPAFSRLSPSFECKESNTSDNLAVDQDMNPVVDFPDTDSTALIKELSEEVFSIGATPSLGVQHSSDEEI